VVSAAISSSCRVRHDRESRVQSLASACGRPAGWYLCLEFGDSCLLLP
jgi:hypothetical protein